MHFVRTEAVKVILNVEGKLEYLENIESNSPLFV